ncbi:MAG: tetratricopeptide repeat protein [Acidobacteriaceae bacterium]|nr:tetratricopeptide repeat protein [Acidobacteriaceae bacterium]
MLGDKVETPRFIETVTKRGYRFVAEVTQDIPPLPIQNGTPARTFRAGLIVAAAASLFVAVLAGSVALWRGKQARRLPERSKIVVADFTNGTGDAVFDVTLRQGLAVQLEQSPYLSFVPEEQIQQALRSMKQPATAKLTREIAREVCQRTGSTVVLEGSIAQIGTEYHLTLRAVSCSNGESLASAGARAKDKNHVLDALGKASSDLRKKLGESLAALQKFDTPLVQATTPSLQALQAYSLGYKEAAGKGDSGAAVPFLQRAISLDPNFALAYSTLGHIYWNLGEYTLAAESIQKAFDLRAGVSEWERLRIEAEYDALVTHNLEKARRAYEVWAETYPKDWVPRNLLGVIHSVLGQFDDALVEYRKALLLNQQSGLIKGNLVQTLVALNRIDEAHAIADQAIVEYPDAPGLRIGLYRVAFLQNDSKGLDEQLHFGMGRVGLEDEFLWNEAGVAAYFGQLQKARAMFDQAVACANRAQEKEAEAGYEADAGLREALLGNNGPARQRVASALSISKGEDVEYHAGLALSLTGDTPRALALAENLNTRFPEDTLVQFIYLPTLRAQVALRRKNPLEAIKDLQISAGYKLGDGLYPVYVRGLAYVAARRGGEATSEFRIILDHRGIVLNSCIGALARVQLGRALVLQGDMLQARSAYQDFLSLWKDADPDVPIFEQAKAEFAKLSR